MPRTAGWEVGRVPGFYKGAGVPAGATLEAGDYVVGDDYLNTSNGNVYRCTTAGSATTSVWTQVGGTITGTSAIVWAQIATQDIASGAAVTTVTFSSLAGDTDLQYQLIMRLLGANAGNNGFRIQFNADGGANYSYAAIENTDGNPTSVRSAATTAILLGIVSQSQECMLVSSIYAKSGQRRTVLSFMHDVGAGGASNPGIYSVGGYWTNTASNITSISIVSDSANNLYGHFELWAQRSVHLVSIP